MLLNLKSNTKMAHILCVASKVGNTIKVNTINKLASELIESPYSWVDKAMKSGVAPNGKKLKPCPFHSGYTGAKVDPRNPANCYTDGITDYGIWFNDYDVIDTCHELETASQEARNKEITECDRIIDASMTRHNNAMEAHTIYESGVEKIKQLELEISKFEQEIKKKSKPVDLEHPEYKVLVQLRDMTLKTISQQEVYQRRVYDRTPENKDICFEDYFKKNCPEKAELVKIELKMKNWINARACPISSELETKISLNKKEIEDTRKGLDKSWKIPYALIYKMKTDLQKVLNTYGRYKYTRDYTKEDIKIDLIKYDSLLGMYHMYVKDTKPEAILTEVEKEQKQAIKNEKVIKSIKTVHKIENSTQYVPIVCLDGVVRYASDEERLIIGSTVSATENWRAGNSIKVGLSAPVDDDSKWSSLRR